MKLTAAQVDRAAGALLAAAAGDALGAGYEFGPPMVAGTPVVMRGGGGFGWSPGEWTDDTAMAFVIASVATSEFDLRTDEALGEIGQGWLEWAETATDVGAQTRAVLSAAGREWHPYVVPAQGFRDAARAHHDRTGRSGGNGALMRTAPVALAYLRYDDHYAVQAIVEAAHKISMLTHHDIDAREACVLWSVAIRHAVLTGEMNPRIGLEELDAASVPKWAARLDEAEQKPPSAFTRNGWVVEALQAAWSAIHQTPVPGDDAVAGTFRVDHLRLSLENAVRGGRDTDTVAAIAGGLLGATYGASAVPAHWRRLLHGWPNARAADLVRLGTAIATGNAKPFDGDYSTYGRLDDIARHPHDDRVWIGGVGALRDLPDGVDAVVSLCRVGPTDVPHGVEHVEVRLIDRPGAVENRNLGFVLHDTVDVIQRLRAEGKTVLLHCVQAQSRTPTVAAMYGARIAGISTATALADVLAVLPHANPIRAFREALAASDGAR